MNSFPDKSRCRRFFKLEKVGTLLSISFSAKINSSRNGKSRLTRLPSRLLSLSSSPVTHPSRLTLTPCHLAIGSLRFHFTFQLLPFIAVIKSFKTNESLPEIGRASCRER